MTECSVCNGLNCICNQQDQDHLRRRLFALAIEIIKNEYPKEQWPDYNIPQMEKSLAEWRVY